MKLMSTLKHELSLFAAATAFAVICALAWGSPFVGNSSPMGGVFARIPAQQQVFRGTVMSNGTQWMLRDSSGQTFRLDNGALAQPYLGKTVTVTGRFDAASKLIQLESIAAPGA